MTATWCCSATPRTPRTSPSARAPSSPWRTRSRWPPACTSTRRASTAALAAYQAERKPVVESTQRAAQASLEWFENIGMYAGQDPAQFVFNLLTRSRRITFENLRERDADFAERVEAAFADAQRLEFAATRYRAFRDDRAGDVPAVRIGALELKNRVIVSPMDMYSRRRGRAGRLPPRPPRLQGPGRRGPGDDGDGLRLAARAGSRSAARACGPTSSATPGPRITELRPPSGPRAQIGLQLGHSGRKGSTKLMWEGMDEPLPDGNWEVDRPVGAALRTGLGHAPRERPGPTWTRSSPTSWPPPGAAREAGFDLLEVHARTATCSPRSSPRCPTAHRRVRRHAGEPAAVPARGLRRRTRGLAS